MLHTIPGLGWATARVRRLYDWMGTFVYSPYGTWILGALFFIESIFFMPTDPLLILFCIEHRKKAFWYATVATIGSVAGGIAAYFIGLSVWETVGQPLINLITTPAKFERLCTQYTLYQKWAVLIAGFTPTVPYKLVTLTAGFCKLPLIPFIVCSLIARGARFYLVAAVVYVWGKQIKEYIDKYFSFLVVLFVLLVSGSLLIFT